MPRLEFSRKTRLSIISRADGKCEKCSAALKVGEGEVDHILPDALGGEPTIANGMLLCRVCHKAKTADDIRRVRKADRQRDKGNGAIRPKGAFKSQGFPKYAKPEKASVRAALPPRQLFKETT